MKVILIILCLMSSSAYAAKYYAKTLVLKGQVSQLVPGKQHATWVKKGTSFKEDTSILTGPKSFIKISILADGSNITLGPNSKIVLNKLRKKKGSIIGMLTGTLRANVVKSKQKTGKKPNKIYIKTRTAAMGIRGTEFIVAMNQKNSVTSLVTLDGEVAMTKVDPHESNVKVEEVVEQAQAAKEEVIVKKGRAATSYLHKEELTAAQKVNPAQLVALKKNETLQAVKPTEAQAVDKIELTEDLKNELYAPDTEEEIAKGLDKVPENGGFVDLKSAIYIPPAETGKEIGKVDLKSGEYIPPEGLKLDVKKGFVVASNEAGEKEKELVKAMNNHVEYQEVPDDYAPGHTDEGSSGSLLKAKNFIIADARLKTRGYKIRGSDEKETTVAGGGIEVILGYLYAKSSRSSFLFELGFKAGSLDKAEYDKDDSMMKDENAAGRVLVGNRYRVARDYTLVVNGMIEEDMFPVFALTEYFELVLYQKTIALPKVMIGIETSLTANTLLKASYTDIFSARNEHLAVMDGKSMTLGYLWNFGSTKAHSLGLEAEISDYKYNEVDMRKDEFSLGYGYRF